VIMPGEHTFNSGSVLLQPLADMVGVGVDKINFVGCLAVSVPYALFYSRVLGKASERTRQIYPLFIGLCYCCFCFGSATKHLLANSLISYALMSFAPAKHIHWLIFTFSMSYLTWVHFYRWNYISEYTIDITGPFMVCVQRLTTLAFSLHDGLVKKEEELSPLQKREAIKRVPDLLPFLSYIFHFQSILTGPLSYFTDYINLTRGTHVKKNENGELPDASAEALVKLVKAGFFIGIIAFLEPRFPPSAINRTDMNPIQWTIYFYFIMSFQRVPYYFAWYFADAIYNLSGFGFNGYDAETGEAKWDLATNVHAWKVESAQSMKETLDAWNVGTMGWLRRVAFDRAPKKYRVLSTYLLSAWWHGIFMGYYLTFLTAALFTIGGQGILMAYTAYPFLVLHWQPSIALYQRFYFIGHLMALFCAVALPYILPPPRQEKKVQEGVKGDENENMKKTE
ncbi:hypothetical protein PRIPAC_74658, partial [Pristionchus pacificus]|uniref:Uncharacterized protein n=1 Tax=Pristionchus pacificus TaxID=54126 RepID=A0A2A6BEQ9_PRIPA